MTTLVEKKRFAERYITTPDGRPFLFDGYEWMLDQFWLPLDGWKLWPVDNNKLCESCAAKANTLVEKRTAVRSTRTKNHLQTRDCAGLKLEPLLVVAINIKRQQGKSFGAAGYSLATAFKQDHESIQIVAASEDQVTRIFNKNYRGPIKRNKMLEKRAIVRGTTIEIPRRNSDIQVTATSLSAVSDTRTRVIVEEARAVPVKVAMAVIPTLFARGGWECPEGRNHTRTHDGVDHPNAPKKCSVCGKKTQPWYGRTLLLSSAGEISDDDGDWFAELIDVYTKNPHPNVHVFRSTENLNPKISKKQVTAFSDIFGNLDSTRTYADIEGANEWRRRGDPFMSESDITRIIDPRLGNEDGNAKPCVAFLDTSQTVEKTCWVVVADDTDLSSDPWEYIYTPRIDVWLPEDMGGVIDDNVVYEHLGLHLPMFPGLRRMLIDTTGRPWAVRLLKRLKQLRAKWVTRVEGIGKHHTESQQGWSVLEQRILLQKLRLMNVAGMMKEFRGAIRKRDPQGEHPEKIVDRNRRQAHRDITEAIAMCCYLIQLEQIRGGSLGLAAARERNPVVDRSKTTRGLEALKRLRASRRSGVGGFTPTRGVDINTL